MSIKLNKYTGISLKKGSSINLSKEGKPLDVISVGLNWGKIERSSIFTNFLFGKIDVDLDASVVVFNKNNEILDLVSYKKLISNDYAINHSGDDLIGDSYGDDGQDNEVITIRLNKLNKETDRVVFFLNSFRQQDFARIPYSKISLYEGTGRNKTRIGNYNLTSEEKYHGHVSAVMAELKKVDNNNWSFKVIGTPTKGRNIKESVREIRKSILN